MRPPRPIVIATLAGLYGVALNRRTPVPVARWILDAGSRLARLPSGTVVHPTKLGGRPAERITVGATERPRAVLYLHGGGYTVGSLATHRSLAAHLARDAGAVVHALDYRLAPEHCYPAALDDAVAAFVDLAKSYEPERIAIAGDSAGGGLAVAAARVLIDEHGLRPGALALLSPWIDPADQDVSRHRDLVVNTGWGRRCAELYLGTGDPAAAGFAPARGNLAGLPPTLVHIGSREVLHRSVLRFVRAMREAGDDVTLREYPRLWHSGHTQAGLVREASDAVREVGTFLREHLRVGTSGAAPGAR